MVETGIVLFNHLKYVYFHKEVTVIQSQTNSDTVISTSLTCIEAWSQGSIRIVLEGICIAI